MRIAWLVAIWIVCEIAALIVVGNAIGLWPTVGVLVAGGLIGSLLLRREGRRVFAAMREAQFNGRAPVAELADGAAIAVAGVLIVLPGLLSDLAAVLLLIPAIRHPVLRRLASWQAASLTNRYRSGDLGNGGVVVDGSVIDGDVVDVRQEPISRPELPKKDERE